MAVRQPLWRQNEIGTGTTIVFRAECHIFPKMSPPPPPPLGRKRKSVEPPVPTAQYSS